MAVLSDVDRAALHALYMSDTSRDRQAMNGLSKLDLRAAVNAIDDWVDTNKASFNSAIPLPARTLLSTPQKAQLLLYVVRRRFEEGS